MPCRDGDSLHLAPSLATEIAPDFFHDPCHEAHGQPAGTTTYRHSRC
ncbi:MAG: hypothetical protein AAF787_07990 [Chloroflexota bacterium]